MYQVIETENSKVYSISAPMPYLRTINFFLIQKDNYLCLIDAGIDNESCWDQLVTTLSSHGLKVTDITHILLTHHHHDHVGLVNRITENHPIPVYAHHQSIPRLHRDDDFLKIRVKFFEQLYHEMGCGQQGEKQVQHIDNARKKNTHLKVNTDILPLNHLDDILDFQVLEVLGHAPDQIAFYHPDKKWLFAGDHLIEHISSNAIVEPDQNGQRKQTLIEYIESLKTCLNLDVSTVFTGHGEHIKNHKELIQKRLTRIDEKSEQILNLIKQGHSTGSEIAQTFYGDKYKSQFSLVMSEIIGQLDYLESKNKVEKVLKEGIWQYHC
ncbi:MBL fold metallo-hydrolase [Desertibacillus haloalkaliphilus]|uniref:MBL fold metallo-hydrolase n=1 Tax=Desertibacillus haloalkaliphilus TaxID=1328930 RepID=UPI001C27337A|nr:MBL fold metallo-hydrolase [Desertibacillus haloalkaliphilus]MBU8908304.1 MBL fold metallo-hydrolase [Desertibacillus haloalkaliphilus]